jgi:hypothetical protein
VTKRQPHHDKAKVSGHFERSGSGTSVAL